MKNRMALFLIMVVILTATHLYFAGKKEALLKKKEDVVSRYEKIAKLAMEYSSLSKEKSDKEINLEEGLLTFIQNSGNKLNLSDRISTMKIIPGSSEGVSVEFKNLSLSEIVEVLKLTTEFSNLRVRVFSINKRFDNPEYADLNMQIEKVKRATR